MIYQYLHSALQHAQTNKLYCLVCDINTLVTETLQRQTSVGYVQINNSCQYKKATHLAS